MLNWWVAWEWNMRFLEISKTWHFLKVLCYDLAKILSFLTASDCGLQVHRCQWGQMALAFKEKLDSEIVTDWSVTGSL